VAKDATNSSAGSYHLLLDGWSVSLLLKNSLFLYEALCQGQNPHSETELPLPKLHCLVGVSNLFIEKFWRETLGGIHCTDFEADRPLGSSSRSQGKDCAGAADPASVAKVVSAAARQHHFDTECSVAGRLAFPEPL